MTTEAVHTESEPGISQASPPHLVMPGQTQFEWFTLQFIPSHTMLYMS